MTSIEINGSFYSLQRPRAIGAWRERTPEGFVFAVKGGRFITHMKKLADVEAPLANFFASGLLALGDKLGPVLWQLPPTLGFDADRAADFFAGCPARRPPPPSWAPGTTNASTGGRTSRSRATRVRHAVEVRHDSFLARSSSPLLREHGIGLVVADTAGKWPLIREVTADFAYVRLHGDTELYASGYSDRRSTSGLPCCGAGPRAARMSTPYFDNDMKVRAPFDAMGLIERLADLGPATA